MKNMFKRFVGWFVCWGLSYLVQTFGWAEQGKAFLYIYLGFSVLVIVLVAIEDSYFASDIVIGVAGTIVAVAILLFATWIATKLFNIGFYDAYQIMSFGLCLRGD